MLGGLDCTVDHDIEFTPSGTEADNASTSVCRVGFMCQVPQTLEVSDRSFMDCLVTWSLSTTSEVPGPSGAG